MDRITPMALTLVVVMVAGCARDGGMRASLASPGVRPTEHAMTLDELPAPVRAAALARLDGGTIGEIETDTEDGTLVYDIEVVKGGAVAELVLREDGSLVRVEHEDADEADDEGPDDNDDDDRGE